MKILLLILIFISTFSSSIAQVECSLDIACVEKLLIDKKSGWKLIHTDHAPYKDGRSYYFYFLPDNKLAIYSQRKSSDPGKKLVHEKVYSLYKFKDGQIGINVSNFFGEISLFLSDVIDPSYCQNTEFHLYYLSKSGELQLVNYPLGEKEYFVNRFQ